MLKRRFDKMLSEGQGRQLLWLLALSLFCIFGSIAIAKYYYRDEISWQYIVGLFFDAGNYGGAPDMGYDTFRIIITLLGVFLFSALLVSVFTNVFENINKSVVEGHRRYRLQHHILIIGSGSKVLNILYNLKDCGKEVVILAERNPKFTGKYIYYYDKRDDQTALIKAGAARADVIYIIGEEGEQNHDDRNLKCLECLQQICADTDHNIYTYLSINQHSTIEVFEYLKFHESGKLFLVDVIDDHAYEAEKLMVNTDFLPVIKQGDHRISHIVIIGTTPMARATAFTAAHISHYPNFVEGKLKTCITFIGKEMRDWMEDLLSSRPGLFSLSEYTYIDADGNVQHTLPEGGPDNDFLDIKWEFVDTSPHSKLARNLLCNASFDSNQILTVLVCHEDQAEATDIVLHLPPELYGRKDNDHGAYQIAVYMREGTHIIKRANDTGMFGHITLFGREDYDQPNPFFSLRSKHGQRVNFIYDQVYGNPPSQNAEEAWYKLPEAHKYSSIYCANAMFLRKRCFNLDGDRRPIYEAEHRRWMMSVLLMGYSAGFTTDKCHFIHADIVPFEKLSPDEQEKDKILIDQIDEIIR